MSLSSSTSGEPNTSYAIAFIPLSASAPPRGQGGSRPGTLVPLERDSDIFANGEGKG
jgi:hypothetical protein